MRGFNDIYERLCKEGYAEEHIALAIECCKAAGLAFGVKEVRQRLRQRSPLTKPYRQPAAHVPNPPAAPIIQERQEGFVWNQARYLDTLKRCQVGWGRLEEYPKEWQR